jgi:hypothetical protein
MLRDLGVAAGAMKDRAVLWWVALVVPTWLAFVYCVHVQPVYFDGWTYVLWHRDHDLTLANLHEFIEDNYVWNNPRLGHLLALIVYTPGPWAAIVVPIVELCLVALLAALVLGRWPSLRRGDDALLAATILAILFATVPDIGPMLFYAPYTGNYLFGLVFGVGLLVPYRFDLESPRAGRWWWSPVLFVVGVAAGLSNEHTGPTVVAIVLAAMVRRRRPPAWMIAGAIGAIVGFLALYFAPGQDVRYQGLATEHSVLERIAERGLVGNARIFGEWLWYVAPAAAWIVLAAIARWRGPREPLPRARAIAFVVAIAAAVAFVITLLASPKQGQRLYFASLAIGGAAIAGWTVAQLHARWARVVAALGAACVIGYSGFRCVTIYRVLGAESRARVAALFDAPPGATVVVPRYSIGVSPWTLADDFTTGPHAPERRKAIAWFAHVGAIELAKE